MGANPTDNQADRRTLLQKSLQALDEMQAKLDAAERARTEPIAIVGLSCRFPGGANDPEAYWQLLRDGRDVIRTVPTDRWDPIALPGDEKIAWYGGFLDGVDRFDSKFFGISPREATAMDPQQRLALEVSWEALERAGQAPDKLNGSQTGVFLGITTTDYSQIVKAGGPQELDVYAATGNALNAAAGRIAYTLGLHGPAMAIDTACSSSLVAVHLACASLRSGESDLALAGGVNVMLAPDAFICFSRWGMMAPDGRCKTFDAHADGFVRGEGCGIVVLKRLSDAQANGDNILAVIRGSAVNQDGRSSGLTVPNGPAQQAVIRRALANANVAPRDVRYIEAHGTGTSLGDPIEVEALGAALGPGRDAGHPLIMGSVKTNIGHLESASGIAGLIKVVLALHNREIPAHLHLTEKSDRIPWPDFPITIPLERMAWPEGRRVAGVSAFGFSGTNAHVVVEEAPEREPVAPGVERPRHLLALSAKSEASLREVAGEYARYLAGEPAPALADVCYTANTGRAHYSLRAALPADTLEALREQLARVAGGQTELRPAGGVKAAFLFTGQGAQYAGMGHALYDTQPAFRRALDTCAELVRPHLKQPLLSVLFDSPSPLDETAYTQPALFALEYALATLWQSWGVEPVAMLGHSVGEYVAACIAGVFSLEDGLRLIAERGRLMQALPQNGAMAAVFARPERVAAAIAPYAASVSIAALNAPENIVISGARADVAAVLAALNAEGIQARSLKVSHAFHSPLLDPMLDEFERRAAQVSYHAPRRALISNVTGQVLEAAPDAVYWRRHARGTVRFAGSMETLRGMGCNTFIEIGPHPTLTGLGQACLPGMPALWLASLRQGRDEWQAILDSLGQAYVAGAPVDWNGFDRGYSRRRMVLPATRFQRQRYWTEPRPAAAHAAPDRAETKGLLGRRLDLAAIPGTQIWENEISTRRFPYLADHCVQGVAVVPATAYVEMVLEAAAELFGAPPFVLQEIENKKVLVLSEDTVAKVQVVLVQGAPGEARFEVHSRSAVTPGAWVCHVTGVLRYGAGAIGTAAERPDVAALRAALAEEIPGAEFYRAMALKGNEWGPAFQGVERLWRENGLALSRVCVPDSLVAETAAYQFHPAVSDACGHVLATTVGMQGEQGKHAALVGGGIREARFYKHPAGSELWAVARLRRDEGTQENVLIGDVQVLDSNGDLVSESLGARLWYLEHDNPLLANPDDWFYDLEWQPRSLTPVEHPQTGTWLVLADSLGVAQALAERVRAQGHVPILVQAGDAYAQPEVDRFVVRPDHPEDLGAVVAGVSRPDRGRCLGVIHLWSLDAANSDALTPAALEAAQVLGCGSTLHLIQALARTTWAQPPHVWLVTRGAQAIDPVVDVAVAQAPLWGFGRALALEHSAFWGGLVDLDPAATVDDAAAQLWSALENGEREDQVALRRGQAYVARLVRHTPAPARPLRWQPDKSYLITGGLGGLGLQVARWMADRGARQIILMGRTPLPDRAEWTSIPVESRSGRAVATIRELEARGVQVRTAAVDVGDEPRLRSWYETYQRGGGAPVAGVVHAAGITQYQSLAEHSLAEMLAILRAKMIGGALLDALFKDEPLDFMVLFSSASALLSSPLTASYAAANAFLDALAHRRHARGAPALSINWGLWGEAGMVADFAAGQPAAERPGMGLMSTALGLDALERLMLQAATQVAVMPVNWAEWQRAYPAFAAAPLLSELATRGPARPPIDAGGARPVLDRALLLAANPDARHALVLEFVHWHAARVLGLALADLSVVQPLGELGLDSLMAIEIKNRIESDLGVAVPVVKLLQGPTLAQLAAQVLELLAAGTTLAALPPLATTGPGVAELVTSLDSLSDEQVNAMLQDLLAQGDIA